MKKKLKNRYHFYNISGGFYNRLESAPNKQIMLSKIFKGKYKNIIRTYDYLIYGLSRGSNVIIVGSIKCVLNYLNR